MFLLISVTIHTYLFMLQLRKRLEKASEMQKKAEEDRTAMELRVVEVWQSLPPSSSTYLLILIEGDYSTPLASRRNNCQVSRDR